MPQLSDFEYQVAITLKGEVQPFTSWITCTEENSKLVGGVPKVDVGNVRVEAGNFRLRPKSNPELVQSNERPYLPKPGPRMYRGTDINSYEDYTLQLLKRIKYDEINIDINDDITTRLGRDRKYETLYLCIHILKYLGFNGPFDNNKINIDKNKFKDYIIKYKDIIEGYFRCNTF